MLVIQPIRDDYFNCFQSILATIGTHWGCGYSMAFAGSWGFFFEESDREVVKDLGTRIGHGWQANELELIKRYHGLEIICHNEYNVDEILRFLKIEIMENRPMAIYIDAFHCPWNKAYKKKHIHHFCLAVGFKDDCKDILCLDPYLSGNIQVLKLENFMRGYGECRTFKLSNKLDDIKWEDLIEKSLLYVSGKINNSGTSIFDRIRSFADEIENTEELKLENSNYIDVYLSDLFLNLKAVSDGRYLFAKALAYMYENCQIIDLLNIAEKFIICCKKWDKIRHFLIKSVLISNHKQISHFKRASVSIRAIADYEEIIFFEMKKILNVKMCNIFN